MPDTHFTALVILVCVHSSCCAAVSCVQGKNSTVYQSDNPAVQCVVPDPLKARSATNGMVAARPAPLSGPAKSEVVDSRWALRVEDSSVFAALKRWSGTAGWQISWEIPVDFPIEIEDGSDGSYEHAVRRVLTALRVSDYPPHPCFHENRVVRVVRRIQGNDDECK